MKQRQMRARLWGSLFGSLLVSLCLAPTAWAQQTLGTVSVSVVDTSGAAVPGALLTLTDLATNDARTGTTQEAGTHTFVNLNFGPHKLTVSLQGFVTQTYDVLVQSARTTDVKATLKVGAMTEVVEVTGGAPLVESSTNAINHTIDMKQIEDLPLAGRNIAQLSRLTAGYNGTWNGLPSFAQSNSVDGIVGNTNRWRYQTPDSAASLAVTPRLENIAEMVVSSDQMDMNQGFGSSSMSITYITRRGTNSFSGRLYEGFRAQFLDAKNFGSLVKPKYHRNDFGASLGGPIIKNKLFFFGSMAALDVPGGTRRTQNYLSDDAKQGVFTYANGAKANIFSIYAAHNAANGTRYPASVSQINAMTSARLAEVDGFRQNDGNLAAASEQPTDLNLRTWEWQRQSSNRTYYPTVRVDSNLSDRWRLNVAINQTKQDSPYANPDHWPGDGRGSKGRSNNATASLGVQTIISPTLINEFRGGWLYTAQWFAVDGSDGFYMNPTINYNYGNYTDNYDLPNSRYQPNFSVSNTTTWTKGTHTVRFGGNWYREVNKYWDPPGGFTTVALGLVEGDPAREVLTREAIRAAAGPGAPLPTDAEWTNARALYAMLAGRISNFSGRHAYLTSTGTYAAGNTPNPGGVAYSTLYELLKSGGLFAQDSWRLKPNLTVNMGLRWDFVQPNKDLTGKYSRDDAPGCLRSDRCRPALPTRCAVADRNLRTSVHRPRSCARQLECHASAVGRPGMDAALQWQFPRADDGWRQVGAARQLFLPAIHDAAAVHLGLWLLVRQSVLPGVQCKSRYGRRTREVLPGQHGARSGRLAAAIVRHLIRSAVLRLQPGAVRQSRPLGGINLPGRLCLRHAQRHQTALRIVLDRGHSAGPGRAASDRGSL
jgi:Carboxypeptidase regulatory-like domain/TonB dependent receptor